MKFVSPESLQRARDEKLAQAADKQAKKSAAVQAEKAKKALRMEKGKTPPSEMFKPPNVPENTYGTWNESGVPLTDGEGVEISKAKGKKLLKEWDIQRKAHDDYLEWVKQGKP